MKINGEDRKFDRPMTVAEMLEAEGYKRTAVAVEVNLEIVPITAGSSGPAASAAIENVQ